jgi:hypothetical protein
MANVVITSEQLEKLTSKMKSDIKESKDGEYMSKQHLFTIATLAYKMWEMMEDGEEIDDWMESKIAQAEQSITSVVKSYLYDEFTTDDSKISGMGKLDYDDLVIGH